MEPTTDAELTGNSDMMTEIIAMMMKKHPKVTRIRQPEICTLGTGGLAEGVGHCRLHRSVSHCSLKPAPRILKREPAISCETRFRESMESMIRDQKGINIDKNQTDMNIDQLGMNIDQESMNILLKEKKISIKQSTKPLSSQLAPVTNHQSAYMGGVITEPSSAQCIVGCNKDGITSGSKITDLLIFKSRPRGGRAWHLINSAYLLIIENALLPEGRASGGGPRVAIRHVLHQHATSVKSNSQYPFFNNILDITYPNLGYYLSNFLNITFPNLGYNLP
ncbi:hypothetical protein MAR_018132 [Mya arenaria]|uniref:Uncharacterized protein n=1 Tax=Mya arenaria TaxID=6604 RepID=A0ABY7EGA0_MYAAR|nr:hypothetical protein MAR_018132 [Mya arenaria]